MCGVCKHVAGGEDELQPHESCPVCGSAAGAGVFRYFKTPVLGLIDLMDELYNLAPRVPESSHLAIERHAESNHQVAVVVFFCALGEALLAHLLQELMDAMQLPVPIREHLLASSPFAQQRVERLFPALSGSSWTEAISTLSERDKANHRAVFDFYLEANRKRNDLLHGACTWGIEEEFPLECMNKIGPLVDLFVSLHNRCVVPLTGRGEGASNAEA
jgi:hypothetical protein